MQRNKPFQAACKPLQRPRRNHWKQQYTLVGHSCATLLALVCDVFSGGSERLEFTVAKPPARDACALWRLEHPWVNESDVNVALNQSQPVVCAWLRRGFRRSLLVGTARCVGDGCFVGVLYTAVYESKVDQPVMLRAHLINLACNEASSLPTPATTSSEPASRLSLFRLSGAQLQQQYTIVYIVPSDNDRLRLRLRELGFRGAPGDQALMSWPNNAPMPSQPTKFKHVSTESA